MNIAVFCCFVFSTMFCFSEIIVENVGVENLDVENLDGLKNGIELGQKVLDQKVERYNELLKNNHKKKQQNINDEKHTEGKAEEQAKEGESLTKDSKKTDGQQDVKSADKNTDTLSAKNESSVNKQLVEENADERELRRLSVEIEEEQTILDKRVERYNKKLQWKSDKEEEAKEHASLVEPLQEEIRRLTDMVERLQKDMKDFKQSAIEGVKGAISPEKKKIKDAFEQALVELKTDVREGITKLAKFVEEHPKEELAIAANLQLGNAYNKIGRWEKAYASFESVMGFDNVIIPQIIEAKLGMAESQIGQNNREAACMTLIKLEKSNNPMSEAQLNRYQRMLVDYHCSSKMDKDERKKEKTKKNFSLLNDSSAKKK